MMTKVHSFAWVLCFFLALGFAGCGDDDSGDDDTDGVTECGNGVVEDGEECDDGNTDAGDGCDAACQEEIITLTSGCGDGVVSGAEECDDGDGTNPVETSTCNIDCTAHACGDGVVNTTAGEECDDGAETASCNVDCTPHACGDTVVNTTAGEDCDDGGESATCNTDCTANVCGDSVINMTAGEDCDDGGESATCNVDCTNHACGDDVVNMTAGEECDDGNLLDDGNGCSADCMRPNQDVFELPPADDSSATATDIPTDGTVIAGNNLDIFTPNTADEDWYKFDVPDIVVGYKIEIFNASCVPGDQRYVRLGLYDSDGTSVLDIEEEVRTGPNPEDRVCALLYHTFSNTGEKYIQVAQNLNGDAFLPLGAYEIAVTALQPDAFEDDDDFSSATAVTVGGGASGGHSIHNALDEDFFSFTTTSTTVHTQIVLTDDECALNDSSAFDIELLDVDGTTVLDTFEQTGTNGASPCASGAYLFPTIGTYFVRVFPRSGATDDLADSYDLQISTFGDAFEPNDDSGSATVVTVDGPALTGLTLLDGQDEDWFVYTVDSTTDLYDIRIEPHGLCIPGDLRTLMMDLVLPDGTTVIGSMYESGGEDYQWCPRLVGPITATGDYYLRVYPSNSEGEEFFAPYGISISTTVPELTEPDDSFGTANPLVLDVPSTGHNFFTDQDEDWFSFDVTSTTDTYRFELNNLGCQNGDDRAMEIHLFNTDGVTELQSDQHCPDIEYTFLAPGTYYVMLKAFKGDGYADISWMYPFENIDLLVSTVPTP